jgi:hypothetical protein
MLTTVETNCRLRQWFAMGSRDDIEHVIKLGGQVVDTLKSRTSGDRESITVSQTIVPSFTTKELQQVSNRTFESIFMLKRSGEKSYAQFGGQPVIADTDGYHVSETEYLRRKNTPLEAGVGTLIEPPPTPWQDTPPSPTTGEDAPPPQADDGPTITITEIPSASSTQKRPKTSSADDSRVIKDMETLYRLKKGKVPKSDG